MLDRAPGEALHVVRFPLGGPHKAEELELGDAGNEACTAGGKEGGMFGLP